MLLSKFLCQKLPGASVNKFRYFKTCWYPSLLWNRLRLNALVLGNHILSFTSFLSSTLSNQVFCVVCGCPGIIPSQCSTIHFQFPISLLLLCFSSLVLLNVITNNKICFTWRYWTVLLSVVQVYWDVFLYCVQLSLEPKLWIKTVTC